MSKQAPETVCPTVPNPYRGTVGQDRESGTSSGTSSGTESLKALAGKVLEKSKAGQDVGQDVGQEEKACPKAPDSVGQETDSVPPSQTQGAGHWDNQNDPESIRVYSQALQREVTVSWHGDDPDQVFVEGQAYSLAEIEELKTLGPEAARAAHKLKTVFMGARVGQSEDPPAATGPVDYDAEIQDVIHEFDMAGVLPAQAPQEIRQETLALEDEITAAANQGDVIEFRRALHKWRLAWLRSLH
jgi:hypothetical protein